MKISRYYGSLLFDDKEIDEILEMVNPMLGPIATIEFLSSNNLNVGGEIARSINRVNLMFFRKQLAKSKFQDNVSRGFKGGRILNPFMTYIIPAGGKSLSKSWAISGSIGEFVERYIGAFSILDEEQDLICGTYKELSQKGYNLLNPDKMKFFHEIQYKKPGFLYKPFTPDTYICWAKYVNLKDKSEYLVPSQITYLSLFLKLGEQPIAYPTTGGLAFHDNYEKAYEHGLLEYLERDGINIAWISKIPANRIILDNEELRDLASQILGPLYDKLYIVKFPTEIKGLFIIGVMGFIKNIFVAGAAADISVKGALLKALTEATQSMASMRGFEIQKSYGLLKNVKLRYEDLDEFSLIMPYYSQEDKRDIVDSWLKGLKEIKVSELIEQERFKSIDELTNEVINDKNYTILVKDFNVEKYLPLNKKLVRVFIPEVTPAHVPNTPFFGHPRYYEAPIIFGLSNKPYTIEDLNIKEPVPFP